MFNKKKRKAQLAAIEMKIKLDGYKLYRGAEKLTLAQVNLEKEKNIIVNDKYKTVLLEIKGDSLSAIKLASYFLAGFVLIANFIGVLLFLPKIIEESSSEIIFLLSMDILVIFLIGTIVKVIHENF